jgi:DNA-binding NtrC family response regulator
VIFLTALTDVADMVTGFRAGGVDYIAKPFHEEELRQRVATHLSLRKSTQALQEQNEILQNEIAQRTALTRERNHLADRLSFQSDEEARRWKLDGFVGHSGTLKAILRDVGRLQQTSVSVLITGESGTGKELVARAIHSSSERSAGPFVPVNCAAIPHELADSLFFGHVKGSFTGANTDKPGYFQLANGGTLFLDEIGDMPLDLQAKLLRALEERAVMSVGGSTEDAVDVRVVSATHTDLPAAIREGGFRQDLYYRLAGFPVSVAALRDRQDDIPLLAAHFLQLLADEMRVPVATVTDAALEMLSAHAFPGNIRELKNIVERALIESGGADIEPKHLHLEAAAPAAPITSGVSVEGLPLNLAEAEIALIQKALARTDGNMAQAAKLLGISRTKLYRRLAQAAGA